MPVLTPDLKERWDPDGWCIVPGVIPPAELAAAQDAMHHHFPTPAETAEQGGSAAGAGHTWDAPWPGVPFHSSRPHAPVLPHRVIPLARRFLGTTHLPP